jgi:hypothetical protein
MHAGEVKSIISRTSVMLSKTLTSPRSSCKVQAVGDFSFTNVTKQIWAALFRRRIGVLF